MSIVFRYLEKTFTFNLPFVPHRVYLICLPLSLGLFLILSIFSIIFIQPEVLGFEEEKKVVVLSNKIFTNQNSSEFLTDIVFDSFNTNQTNWEYYCLPQQHRISGRSMVDDQDNIINPQTVTWTEKTTGEQILFTQLAGRFMEEEVSSLPNQVVFSLESLGDVQIEQPTNINFHSYGYVTQFQSIPPVMQITATIDGDVDSLETIRGVLVYRIETSLDERELQSSIGRITNHYVHESLPNQYQISEMLTFKKPIPINTVINVRVAIVDYNMDGRQVNLSITAGGVSKTITEVDFGEEKFVNIVDIDLPATVITTNQVDITLVSPANGDSVVLAGVSASYQCSNDDNSNNFEIYFPIAYKSLDLNVNLNSIPDVHSVGLPLDYIIEVENNNASEDAEELELIYTLPVELKLNPNRLHEMNADPSCEPVTNTTRTIKCSIDTLLSGGASFRKNVFAIPIQSGYVNNRVFVSSKTQNAGGIGTYHALITECIPGANDFSNAIEIFLDSYCSALEDTHDYFYIELTRTGTLSIEMAPMIGTPHGTPFFVQLATYKSPPAMPLTYTQNSSGNVQLSTPINRPGGYFILAKTWSVSGIDYPRINYILNINFIP